MNWPRFHLWMTVAWGLLLVPTVVFWPQSILWLALMSCYANFAGHFSAWQAAKAEQSSDPTTGEG